MRWLKTTFELDLTGRLVPMEGLRGLAVFLVFLHHYAVQALNRFPPTGKTLDIAVFLKNYGNLGVELFFVLSGFLIYGMLAAKRPPFVKFMRRRVMRIYPAFLVALGLAVFADTFSSQPDIPKDLPAGFYYLIANILLLPGLFPIEPVLTVAWSLSYEFFFYLVTAAVVLTLPLDRVSRNVRIVGIVAVTAAFIASDALGVHVPIRMLPFFAGMLLAEVLDAGARISSLWPVAAVILAAVLDQTDLVTGVAREAAHSLAFFLLCWVAFQKEKVLASLFSWSPARWLGNMSYSYYLVHGFAVVVLALIAGKVAADGWTNQMFWLLLPVFFVASLIPAALLFIFIEKPFSLDRAKAKGMARAVDIGTPA